MKRLTFLFFCTLIFITGCASSTGRSTIKSTTKTDDSVTRQFVASEQAVEQVIELQKQGILSNVKVMESEPAQVVATGAEKVLACVASQGGRWLQDYNECEYLPKQQCEELGGEFNECSSACRHDPDAMMCVLMCVQVCQFSE